MSLIVCSCSLRSLVGIYLSEDCKEGRKLLLLNLAGSSKSSPGNDLLLYVSFAPIRLSSIKVYILSTLFFINTPSGLFFFGE